MKKISIGILGFCLLTLALISCSSQKAETGSASLSEPAASNASVVADRERQIGDLERRLDTVRDTTHRAKFGSVSRRTDRRVVDDQYAQIRTARTQLDQLRATNAQADFDRVRQELDRTIASIQTNVDRFVAE